MRARPFWRLALKYATEAAALRRQLEVAEQDRDAAICRASERLTEIVLLERQVALLLQFTPSDLREMGA